MLRVLMFLSCTFFVNGLTCPPSCDPPVKESGCKAYTKNAVCSQDVKDISSSEAHCGCLWQTYIQTVEPQARVIFTDEGNQCYKWAAKLCSILEKKEKFLLSLKRKPELDVIQEGSDLKNIVKQLQHLESINMVGGYKKEKAKHRRRNGVGILSKETERLLNKERQELVNSHRTASKHNKKDRKLKAMAVNRKHKNYKNEHRNRNEIKREFIGKPGQIRQVSVKIPKEATMVPAVTPSQAKVQTSGTVKDMYKVRRHWIDVDMPVDQFKLGVFTLILLLNILVVVVLILCRESGTYKKNSGTRPTGDLDGSMYQPDSPDEKPGEASQKKTESPISKFVDSFRKKMKRDKRRSKDSNEYLQMMEKSSPYIDARMSGSPRQISQGLYESLEEPDTCSSLDHTYEEPLPALSTQFYKRRYSLRSDSASDDGSLLTKYFPRDVDDTGNKSVAFALPPGTYLTLQDRVGTAIDGSTNTEPQETP